MIIFVIYLKIWNIFSEFLDTPDKTAIISRGWCSIERVTDCPKEKVTNKWNVKQNEVDYLLFFYVYVCVCMCMRDIQFLG
jgi:hypothetical protein